MGAYEKAKARRRAVDRQRKKNEDGAERDLANAADAESIRATLRRVGAVDTWERRRFDQATENIRADAVKRRAGHFRGLLASVEKMRGRGLTVTQIAELVGVNGREIQAELRRARAGGRGAHSRTSSVAPSQSAGTVAQDVSAATDDPVFDGVDQNHCADGVYDPTRCVRCDALMLDEEVSQRRGRRRLYCSDTCRRDASAARMAAERFGDPIRVVEVPKAAASHKHSGETPEIYEATAPLDAALTVVEGGEALRRVLALVAEQARLKKLDRATLTAARELSNAVHRHRDW